MILRGKGEAKVSFDLVYYIDESNFTPEEKEAFDRLKSNPESPEYIKLENILYNKYAVKLVKRQVDIIGCKLKCIKESLKSILLKILKVE